MYVSSSEKEGGEEATCWGRSSIISDAETG